VIFIDLLLIPIFIMFSILSIILIWINLPGTFIYFFIIAILGALNGFNIISKNILLVILLVFILFEIIEFLLLGLTVKVYDGKKSSIFLSILGGISGAMIGSFIFPFLGALIGLIMGTYLVTYFNERREGKNIKDAVKVADSTMLGYVLSKGIKSVAVISLTLYLIYF
tara:strand:- start:25688 stop:26191 length:504 start_codon:yes stop_codon:yes gene_type:complete